MTISRRHVGDLFVIAKSANVRRIELFESRSRSRPGAWLNRHKCRSFSCVCACVVDWSWSIPRGETKARREPTWGRRSFDILLTLTFWVTLVLGPVNTCYRREILHERKETTQSVTLGKPGRSSNLYSVLLHATRLRDKIMQSFMPRLTRCWAIFFLYP